MGPLLLTHPGLGVGHTASPKPWQPLELQEEAWALDPAPRTH